MLSCEYCKNFKNTYFEKHLGTDCFCKFQISYILKKSCFKCLSFYNFVAAHAFSFDSCAILENSIYYVGFLVPEAVAQICFVKILFLEILQNSLWNTCVRVSFLIKFFKKETLVQVFYSEFCKVSKSAYFYRTPPMAVSLVHLGRFQRCNLGELV